MNGYETDNATLISNGLLNRHRNLSLIPAHYKYGLAGFLFKTDRKLLNHLFLDFHRDFCDEYVKFCFPTGPIFTYAPGILFVIEDDLPEFSPGNRPEGIRPRIEGFAINS